MRGKPGYIHPFGRVLFFFFAFALAGWFSPVALGQQLLSADTSVGRDCLLAVSDRMPVESSNKCNQQPISELARSGHAFAENQMGIESALVLGPQRRIGDARKWFEKAAGKGYAPAQVNLAVLYLNGWGGPQNYGAALYWLKSAADKGKARAHTNLGILYLKGWGVTRDYDEALKNFHYAAEHGETGAMDDL